MPLGYVIYNLSVLVGHSCIRTSWVQIGTRRHIYISAWGFSVARFDKQGNSQEPQNVKRATVQGFTLFHTNN